MAHSRAHWIVGAYSLVVLGLIGNAACGRGPMTIDSVQNEQEFEGYVLQQREGNASNAAIKGHEKDGHYELVGIRASRSTSFKLDYIAAKDISPRDYFLSRPRVFEGGPNLDTRIVDVWNRDFEPGNSDELLKSTSYGAHVLGSKKLFIAQRFEFQLNSRPSIARSRSKHEDMALGIRSACRMRKIRSRWPTRSRSIWIFPIRFTKSLRRFLTARAGSSRSLWTKSM